MTQASLSDALRLMSSVCCQREGHKLYLCMCFTTDSERSYVSSHKA